MGKTFAGNTTIVKGNNQMQMIIIKCSFHENMHMDMEVLVRIVKCVLNVSMK